ncbi:MAG TPA: DPP IV N-terminal domain-containing protein, partial [Pyrinomonadaceae bacterium]|nr:DPP IV N-terminal domain-containing protein [Pyrinomonadaceae bacterium]
MKKISLLFALFATCTFTLVAQTVLTESDYARAESRLGYGTAPLVDRNGVRPVFQADGRFYYQVLTATGVEFVLVDPSNGSKKSGKTLAELGVTPGAPGGAPAGRRGGGGNEVRSPDGKLSVFIKDWNLWLKDLATNKETQLTTDGIKDFGYATNNAGWTHSDRPVVLWSPDSKKIATFQQDQRFVSDMYIASTEVGGPKLEAWKYPLPGDKEIVKISRVIIDVPTAKVIRLKIAPDDHRSTLCDDISCGGSFDDNDWSPDGSKLAFVSTSRDHKSAKFRIADAATGEVRAVFEENVATQ